MVPVQSPVRARGTTAPAQQFKVESRGAGGVGLQFARGGGGNGPARFGNARRGLGIEAEHQQRRASIARAQRKAASGGEVEQREFAPAFDDHRRRTGAAHGIIGAGEQHLGVGGLDQQQTAGIAAEFGDAGGIDMPRAAPGIDSSIVRARYG